MFTIVLYHILQYVSLPSILARANLLGGAGIYIFLFASSYGLYFSKISSWTSFYIKRFKKVLVPYYVGITIIFLINFYVGIYPNNFKAYLSHIFLYKMFFEYYTGSFGVHFWFVSTIIQFYLIYPILIKFAEQTKASRFLLISFGISFFYSILVYKLGLYNKRIWYSSVIQYLGIVMLGLAIAKQQWLPRLLKISVSRYALLFVLGICYTLAINLLMGAAGNVFNDYGMFMAYFSGCVILFVIGQHVPVIIRIMLWIESFSYSLYITHLFMFALYLKVLVKTKINLVEVPIVIALCILTAILFNKVVNHFTNLNLTRVSLQSRG
jgi:peptidoglycan/LPS O-acetylase OafA/YrhL